MKTKDLSYRAIMIALVSITTMFLSFPIGGLGYLNLGDVVIMIGASVFGPISSFIFGGFGSALADLFMGYSQYALFTFFIKGLEGLVFSYLYIKGKKTLAFVAMAIIILLGYGFTDVVLTGEIASLLPSIAANSVQVISAIIVSVLLIPLVSERLRKQLNEPK